MREQIKLLEYQTEILLDLLHLGLWAVYYLSGVARGDGFFIQINDFSLIDGFEKSRTAKQRGFTASGRSDDTDHFAVLYGKINTLQNFKMSEPFMDIFHLKDYFVLIILNFHICICHEKPLLLNQSLETTCNTAWTSQAPS